MRRSELTALAEHAFGPALAPLYIRETRLGPLGDRTAAEALAEGADVRAVWTALCEAMDVPESQRWEIPDPRRPR